jgi:hypothetical protein
LQKFFFQKQNNIFAKAKWILARAEITRLNQEKKYPAPFQVGIFV